MEKSNGGYVFVRHACSVLRNAVLIPWYIDFCDSPFSLTSTCFFSDAMIVVEVIHIQD